MSLSTVASKDPVRADEQPPTRGLHLYSASDVNRVTVINLLGTIAAIFATGAVLLLALPFPHLGTQLSAWGGVLIASALFPLIFAGFGKRAWRWRAAASMSHWTAPDLSGGWRGDIVITKGTEAEKEGVPLSCHVEIQQDWSRIAIDLETRVSRSWSVMANINARGTGDEVRYELHYEYYVVPRADARPEDAARVELVDPHYGTARLDLEPGPWPHAHPTVLSGIWFNDQHFQRWGTIKLERDT
jgi:SMODS-associating 2TM, beta-strand rich effector domain